MEWSLVFQVSALILTLLGIVIAGFWRLWELIKGVRDEAALRAEAAHAVATTTRDELHAHKLHVAEHYITRTGLREFEDRIVGAIDGIGTQMSEMRGRIDRVLERPSAPRTRSSS